MSPVVAGGRLSDIGRLAPVVPPRVDRVLAPAMSIVEERWRTLRGRMASEARAFVSPNTRMVDEAECVASVLLAILFAHLIGAQNVSWAAFSGYMVMRGHVSESLLRGVLRIAGTLTGALLALMATSLVATNLVSAAVLLAVVGGATLYAAITAKRAYAWLFVGLTFVMILLDKLEHPGQAVIAFAETRVLEVVAGTLACVLVSTLSTLTLRRRWPAPPAPAVVGIGWHAQALRHAGQAAVALAVLPFLGHAWRIPELSQSAVTIMAVMIVPASGIGVSGFMPVSRRLVQRVAGCALGALLAGMFLFAAHGSAAVLIAGTVIGVVLGRHIENSQTSIAYAGTQFTLAVLVTLVPDSYSAAAIGPALARLAGIGVGILALEPALLAWHLVAPSRKTQQPQDPHALGDI
jgi:uncharacterized membrane protein YccC